jgi:hypothetical protein
VTDKDDAAPPPPSNVLPFVPADQQSAVVVEQRGQSLRISLSSWMQRRIERMRKDRS